LKNNLNFLSKFHLKEKNVLITGAGGLLGREHSEAVLESGANLIMTDINLNSLKNNFEYLKNKYIENSIYFYLMDVTDLKSINNLNKELSYKNCFVDILINNAAIDPKNTKKDRIKNTSRLENFSIDQWELELNVGLTGAFSCIKVFGGAMSRRKEGGVILNISSDLSVIAPNQELYRNDDLKENEQSVKPVTYSVIKTGLVGLTKYVATYWAKNNVRCNSISPGGVFNDHEEEFVNKLSKLIPLGRMASKDEYRSAIQFLCSDASSYMTGHNLVIDGGRSIW